MHLLVDIEGANQAALRVQALSEWLYRFPRAIDMTRVLGPLMNGSDGEGEISGVVVIVESHISVHAFPARAQAYIDIFSCRAFDVERVLEALVQQFGGEARHQVLERGLELLAKRATTEDGAVPLRGFRQAHPCEGDPRHCVVCGVCGRHHQTTPCH